MRTVLIPLPYGTHLFGLITKCICCWLQLMSSIRTGNKLPSIRASLCMRRYLRYYIIHQARFVKHNRSKVTIFFFKYHLNILRDCEGKSIVLSHLVYTHIYIMSRSRDYLNIKLVNSSCMQNGKTNRVKMGPLVYATLLS